jgi:hypothetical protein
VSTLDALAAGAPGAVPVVDARRREVFALLDGEPRVLAPADLSLDEGTVCVGSGAVRYRQLLEEKGVVVPPDGDERHLPRARFHAQLAGALGPVDDRAAGTCACPTRSRARNDDDRAPPSRPRRPR